MPAQLKIKHDYIDISTSPKQPQTSKKTPTLPISVQHPQKVRLFTEVLTVDNSNKKPL